MECDSTKEYKHNCTNVVTVPESDRKPSIENINRTSLNSEITETKYPLVSSGMEANLAGTFNIPEQFAEKDVKVIQKKDRRTDSDLLFLSFVEHFEQSRFGLDQASTIIRDNVIAPNDLFSWNTLTEQVKELQAVAGQTARTHKDGAEVTQMLISTDDCNIYKPVDRLPDGPTEVAFYSHISKSCDPMDIKIKQCAPQFMGVKQFCIYDKNGISKIKNFMMLSNITFGFVAPNIMDVKIGGGSVGHREKIGTTRNMFGYSVAGISVHSLKPGLERKHYSKAEFGSNLKPEEVMKIPETFFDYGNTGTLSELYNIVEAQIKDILAAVRCQRNYIILRGSMLLAYDADAVQKFRMQKLTKQELENYVNVKLIDWGNVYNSNGLEDTKYVNGLMNLLKHFQEFAKNSTKSMC